MINSFIDDQIITKVVISKLYINKINIGYF